MSFSIGIVGLPNAGKSTLFKALTKKQVDIAAYPFTTLQPNHGIVAVPDGRLEALAKITQPEKITPTAIEFVDIAGLVKGAHKGEGLGNQFLANIRNCDAIVEVVRVFDNEKVEHVEGAIDPERDAEIIKTEILMKDLETLENSLSKLEKEKNIKPSQVSSKFGEGKDRKSLKQKAILAKIKDAVSHGKLISDLKLNDDEQTEIKEFQFLTAKPIIYLFNSNSAEGCLTSEVQHLTMNLKLEEEASELSEKETKDLGLVSYLDQLILNCYNALDLITFFTIAGGKETRAWTIKRNTSAILAGGKVHSDFEEKFIRAEVITCQKLTEAGSWLKARELGWIKTVGKEYIVEEGDVIEFKI